MRTMQAVATVAILSAAASAWAAAPAEKTFVNSAGMTMVRIEAGSFRRGEGSAAPASKAEWELRDADEAPAHKVTISRAFHLAAHEVTNAQYEKFDPDHRKLRGRGNGPKADDEPVAYVTWQQANDYCRWLSEKEGKPYRLPTEAEWEFACRAGTTTAFSTGDALTAAQANFGLSPENKRIGARAVGSYPANAWGLFDMHGNVAEWCQDWYGPYDAADQTDPVGRADGGARVVRGWSWLHTSEKKATRYCRSANRSGHLPDDANRCTGFRVVMGDAPTGKPLPVVIELHQKDVKPHPPRTTAVRDPKVAYFQDFTKDRRNPTIPKDSWGPVYSAWNHFAAVCVCPNGDVLAVWYTTVSEEGRECAQAASRLRAGADRWEPASFFFGTPDVNTHAPVLVSDGKRLWHFATQSLRGWDDAANIVRFSDDSGATWSKPRFITLRDMPGKLSQPCSAFVAADGTIVLACDGDSHNDERVVIGNAAGTEWRVAAGDLRKAAGKYAIHPAVIPADDGGILAFVRGPDPMPAFLSRDKGATWEAVATGLPGISVGQKAAALRLSSGAILVVSADNGKKLVGGGTYAALSADGGKTWPHVRKLEGASGYLAAAQAPDGVVYVVGSKMGCTAFNEAWLRAASPAPQ